MIVEDRHKQIRMKQKIQDLKDRRNSAENAEMLFKVDPNKKIIPKNVAITPFYNQYAFARRNTMQQRTFDLHQRVIEKNEKQTLEKMVQNKFHLQKWSLYRKYENAR